MMLYNELKSLFPETRGAQYESIDFAEIFIDPAKKVNKGLFVVIKADNEDEQLKRALYNGAIGALWPSKVEIPRFVPNDFPLFLVDHTLLAVNQIIDYADQNGNEIIKNTHIEENGTYDSAVKQEIINLNSKLNLILNNEGSRED